MVSLKTGAILGGIAVAAIVGLGLWSNRDALGAQAAGGLSKLGSGLSGSASSIGGSLRDRILGGLTAPIASIQSPAGGTLGSNLQGNIQGAFDIGKWLSNLGQPQYAYGAPNARQVNPNKYAAPIGPALPAPGSSAYQVPAYTTAEKARQRVIASPAYQAYSNPANKPSGFGRVRPGASRVVPKPTPRPTTTPSGYTGAVPPALKKLFGRR